MQIKIKNERKIAMKALGIIRKLDDLGRVVVPKEVRRTQGWEAGQPLEMFMSGEGLVIKAYKGDEEKDKALSTLKRTLETVSSFEGGPAPKLVSEIQEVIEYLENK